MYYTHSRFGMPQTPQIQKCILNLVKSFLGMAKTEAHQELHIMRVYMRHRKVHLSSHAPALSDSPAHLLKDIQYSCGFLPQPRR